MKHASRLRCLEGVEPSLAYRSAGLAESISGNQVFLILGAIIKAHGKNVKLVVFILTSVELNIATEL